MKKEKKVLELVEENGQVYFMFGYDEESEELILELEDIKESV